MRVFRGFDALPVFVNPVVTIGSFDGVHRGHRKLISRLKAAARRIGGESVIITFDPHPRSVLGNRGEPVKLLNSLEEKAILLESLGVDHLIVAPFTVAFSRISPYDFLRDYLIGKIGVKRLMVGYNHHFGRDHQGNFDYLKSLQKEFNFRLLRLPEQSGKGSRKISSTEIRHLIDDRKMDEASELLGAPYFALIRYGRPADPLKLMPPAGIYEVMVHTPGNLPLMPGPVYINIDRQGRVGFLKSAFPFPDECIIRFRMAAERTSDYWAELMDPLKMSPGEVWLYYQ